MTKYDLVTDNPSKKTRVRSAMKDNTTNPSSLVDWSRLIDDNKEEEEEEIPFVHHEKISKKHNYFNATSTQKLNTTFEELDFSIFDAELNESMKEFL